jgi:acyl carrier protein
MDDGSSAAASRAVRRAVRRFVAENFLYRADPGPGPDDGLSLRAAGAMDSVNVLELVLYLESTFGISVDDDEIVPANFDSVAAISGYVERKLAGRRLERFG